jgi:hypothetical protein
LHGKARTTIVVKGWLKKRIEIKDYESNKNAGIRHYFIRGLVSLFLVLKSIIYIQLY